MPSAMRRALVGWVMLFTLIPHSDLEGTHILSGFLRVRTEPHPLLWSYNGSFFTAAPFAPEMTLPPLIFLILYLCSLPRQTQLSRSITTTEKCAKKKDLQRRKLHNASLQASSFIQFNNQHSRQIIRRSVANRR